MNEMHPFRTLSPLFRRSPWGEDWREFWGTGEGANGEWAPQVDVVEQPESYVLKAEMAGLKAEDIHVRLHGDTLTLSGEKKQENKEDNDHYKMVERRYGAFQRTFVFPTPVNDDNVEADLADGVLTVRVMKKAEGRPAKIKVKSR